MLNRPEPYRVAGGVAVVTGAASGMGEQMAHRLAALGSDLALVDRDATGLAQTIEAVQRTGVRVSSYAMDLGEKSAAVSLADRVLADHGRVTLVINNAGVGLAGMFSQVSMNDVDWLLDINLRATMAVTSAFLPRLESGSHITNISSLFGLIGPVGNAAYSASKFGVRGFSQVLRAELAPKQIGVTAVFPGGIRTAIAKNSRRGTGVSDAEWDFGQAMFEKFLVIDPDTAARRIVTGTIRRRARVLIGPEAYVGDAVARVAPASATQIFEGLMRLKARLG
jgi:short-subunit dehydrogenase